MRKIKPLSDRYRSNYYHHGSYRLVVFTLLGAVLLRVVFRATTSRFDSTTKFGLCTGFAPFQPPSPRVSSEFSKKRSSILFATDKENEETIKGDETSSREKNIDPLPIHSSILTPAGSLLPDSDNNMQIGSDYDFSDGNGRKRVLVLCTGGTLTVRRHSESFLHANVPFQLVFFKIPVCSLLCSRCPTTHRKTTLSFPFRDT